MDRIRGRRQLFLFLAATAIVGGLTFVSARPVPGGASLSDESVRRALLEAVGVGSITAAFMTSHRRQWKNFWVVVFLGASAGLWIAVAPTSALHPTGTALLVIAFVGVPLQIARGFWQHRRS